ncbi:MAG: DegT/DnrJ/EryC1/StrS family aminotransferase [Caldilineaceae bacterium]
MTAAQATIALQQLPRLGAYNRVRRGHAERIRSAVMETAHFHGLAIAPESDPFYLRFPVIFHQPQLCAAVHAALQGNGIGAGRMYKAALADLFPQLAGDFPSGQVAAGLLTLPTHHFLTHDDITRMATIMRAAVSG